MKILTGEQIRNADLATIKNEPVESIALMERAAEAIAQAICTRIDPERELLFCIGKGNNGGDGLAVARILSHAGFRCSVWMVYDTEELSEECLTNYERLPEKVNVLESWTSDFSPQTVIIDAVTGSGLKGNLKECLLTVIERINGSGREVISIDLPSGMKTEFDNNPAEIVRADLTITIQFPKLAMLLPEAGESCGEIIIVDIELDEEYINKVDSDYYFMDRELIKSFILPRLKFGYKNTYGHALLICGSEKMTGAAILATGGALRSGCGLVTAHIPKSAAFALNANHPSAMVSMDCEEYFSMLPENQDKYDAIGIGCGLGMAEPTKQAFSELLRNYSRPVVIDADALNIIAESPEVMPVIPPDSILTPHPGEFKRLVGKWGSEEEKLNKLRSLASKLASTIVLKGAYSMVCFPQGDIYVNSTGSPGMAKAGNGDILTGLITGLIARGYPSKQAALIGVYLHGTAGEKADSYYGQESSCSSDLIDFLAEAYIELAEK